MQEIEAKFFVNDLNRIRERLEQVEARLIQERILETNLRFDQPDGRLRSDYRVLRLRRDTESRLTYKGPSELAQGVLSRLEIEFIVDDFDKAERLLTALGYQIIFTYEKFRTTFELEDTHILLDELPMGNFVEIEGASSETIKAVADRLGLDWERSIPTGYHVLYDRLRAKRNDLDPARLTFDALKGKTVSPEELCILPADR
jgi:adenylate cyclase class 2